MRTVAACGLNPPALQDVGWVLPKWGDEGRGTRWPPQISELWGEVEHSTEAGISSVHHQYPKPGEETFIRVTEKSSMVEWRPGKSIITHSLYWDLLKSLISIFSFCICLSLQLGFFTEYLWDYIFMPCPIRCLRTLGPKSKLLFSQGIKCQLNAGIQSSASHCFFSVWILKFTFLPWLVTHVPAWTRCQQNGTVPPQSHCPAAFASAAAGGNILNHSSLFGSGFSCCL